MTNKRLKRYLFKGSFRVFLLYMITFVVITSVYNESSLANLLARTLSFTFLSIIMFILNIEVIFYYRGQKYKAWDMRKRQTRIFGVGFLSTFIFFILYYLGVRLLDSWGFTMHLPDNLKNGFSRILLMLFLITLVQYTFIYLIQHAILTLHEQKLIETEMLKLKNSNAETVNQLLQQQIKPHFLFNALTTLKSLIKKHPDAAETYLQQLSEFLRASFANTGAGSGLAAISDELKVCRNYMEMQKVRFGDALQYEVSESVKNSSPAEYIPAFSLQPLLENAIKHNVVTNERPLSVKIYKEADMIVVSNNLQPKSTILHSTGNGLSNLKERYQIISGDEVVVRELEDKFMVSIKILSV